MKIIISSLIITCLIALNSCFYDKEDLLYGAKIPCTDTTGSVSYSQKLIPILQQNCYGCHTGSFPSGGIVMGSYTADKGIAQYGKLYGSVSHSTGFSPMPKGMPMLNVCQLSTIRKWIDAGMPNN